MGRVLSAIEEAGLADNTVVMFVGDHGLHVRFYGITRITTSAKLMSYSSHVTLCPGWSMEGFKCLNQGHLNV